MVQDSKFIIKIRVCNQTFRNADLKNTEKKNVVCDCAFTERRTVNSFRNIILTAQILNFGCSFPQHKKAKQAEKSENFVECYCVFNLNQLNWYFAQRIRILLSF